MSHRGLEIMPGAKPPSPFVNWRSKAFKVIGIAIFIFFIAINIRDEIDKNDRLDLPIVTTSYVWTTGCVEKKYNIYSEISQKCKSDKYYLGRGFKYGFDSAMNARVGRYTFYRVGNDAISFSCKSQREECKVIYIKYSVFKVKPDE